LSFSTAVDTVYQMIDEASFDFQLIPADYRGSYNNSSEFVSVSVLTPGGDRVSYGEGSISTTEGILAFSVFTENGKGPGRLKEITDQLDQAFSLKSNGNVHFGKSSLRSIGQDPQNQNLSHAEYSLQFKIYGE